MGIFLIVTSFEICEFSTIIGVLFSSLNDIDSICDNDENGASSVKFILSISINEILLFFSVSLSILYCLIGLNNPENLNLISLILSLGKLINISYSPG